MSASSRDVVLARIREALDRGRAQMRRRGIAEPTLPEAGVPVEALGAPPAPADREELIARFDERLSSVGGHVRRCADEREASEAIRSIAGEMERIAVSDDPLIRRLAKESLGERAERFGPDATRDELVACELGLTGAQHGIAETGTLVMRSRAERHRLLSLVPPIHVAVLRIEDIVPDLRTALGEIRGDPAATFITGPSRTGDIELTLSVGVHGPKELHVLLLGS